jgi:hypothetical protein
LEKQPAQRKEYKMKGIFTTLAILGVALIVIPIPNAEEVEWFPPDVARDIAKFHESMNSEAIARAPRDSSLRLRPVGKGSQKIVNDQLDR